MSSPLVLTALECRLIELYHRVLIDQLCSHCQLDLWQRVCQPKDWAALATWVPPFMCWECGHLRELLKSVIATSHADGPINWRRAMVQIHPVAMQKDSPCLKVNVPRNPSPSFAPL